MLNYKLQNRENNCSSTKYHHNLKIITELWNAYQADCSKSKYA